LGGTQDSAAAINSFGVAVGRGLSPVSGIGFRAVIFESGTCVDLNSLVDPSIGVSLEAAGDVNDLGQILATAHITDSMFNRIEVSYLLTPVPEPGAIICLLGIFLVGGRAPPARSRRRNRTAE